MAAEATLRFLRKMRGWKTISSVRSLTFSSGHGLPSSLPLHNFSAEELMLESEKKSHKLCIMFPALLMGVFGWGAVQVSHADDHEADSKRWAASGSASDFSGMEKIVSEECYRLEEFLRRKGMARGSYPSYTVAMKGNQISIKFPIPQTCKKSHLIANLVSHLGLKKAEDQAGGAQMMLQSWDSAVAWQLTLSYPQKQIEIDKHEECPPDKDTHNSSLCILIFESLISSDKAEIEFIKQESFSMKELEAVASALKIASRTGEPYRPAEKTPWGDRDRRDSRSSTVQAPSIEKSLSALEAMGVRVFGLDRPFGLPADECGVSWENIAGYHEQKRDIEDTILLALQNPEVYDDIARGTRFKFESNRPRAVLFEGPPGTGKTSCARVIATQAGVPLLYVPLEIVMSKYYGESERLFGQVFSLANDLPNGAIIFLDEVDSFAATRDSEMHEATRRILSVLLRQIDGFEQDKRVVVVAATNRKEDLDPALISRFDSMITFGLPDQQTREEIAAQYARHLNKSELAKFAAVAEGMSGRDIRDVCQQAERHWASKMIRGHVLDATEQGRLPPIQEYLECAEQRKKALSDISEKKSLKQTSGALLSKKQPLALA
ncbi:hypothetical protein H6P81_020058 [Aristolochia fimbriata]|uniref:AAA+ ATPase domain-containing protein n=1 Tax=Aristolochia fimbriata TaxID=158543 RepID=A0AAV7DY14_ARIFI|nr:hypothetical protein H6P81_020058 [Aristolochia fimbriata]